VRYAATHYCSAAGWAICAEAGRMHRSSEAAARPIQRSLQGLVPKGGEVRLLLVTERQYERMWIFQGRKRLDPERPLPQLVLI
jgi:hypothetical protein